MLAVPEASSLARGPVVLGYVRLAPDGYRGAARESLRWVVREQLQEHVDGKAWEPAERWLGGAVVLALGHAPLVVASLAGM